MYSLILPLFLSLSLYIYIYIYIVRYPSYGPLLLWSDADASRILRYNQL